MKKYNKMKYITGIVLGLVLGGVGVVYAKSDYIGYRKFEVAGEIVYKFIDPDNGNVCYLTSGGYGISPISCLKP